MAKKRQGKVAAGPEKEAVKVNPVQWEYDEDRADDKMRSETGKLIDNTKYVGNMVSSVNGKSVYDYYQCDNIRVSKDQTFSGYAVIDPNSGRMMLYQEEENLRKACEKEYMDSILPSEIAEAECRQDGVYFPARGGVSKGRGDCDSVYIAPGVNLEMDAFEKAAKEVVYTGYRPTYGTSYDAYVAWSMAAGVKDGLPKEDVTFYCASTPDDPEPVAVTVSAGKFKATSAVYEHADNDLYGSADRWMSHESEVAPKGSQEHSGAESPAKEEEDDYTM